MFHEESTWRPRCAQFSQSIRKKDQVGQALSKYGTDVIMLECKNNERMY